MTATLLTCLYAGDDITHFKKYLHDVCENRANLKAVIIVVDGQLPVELNNLLSKITEDPVFNIIKLSKNKGLVNALNIGLEACTTKFCIRLDPDDRMSKNRVERVIEEFDTSDADFVFNGVHIIDDNDLTIQSDVPVDDVIYQRNPYYHSGSAYKVDSIRRLGGYRQLNGFEDYDLWLRAKKHGLHIRIIPKTMTSFRLSMDTIKRRAGLKYFWYELIFIKSAFVEGNISFKFLPFWILRLISRLLPKLLIMKLRSYYFKFQKNL